MVGVDEISFWVPGVIAPKSGVRTVRLLITGVLGPPALQVAESALLDF